MSETVEYKGYTIKLEPDDNIYETSRDWDNLGTMVCWHKRYTLGDWKVVKEDFPNVDDFRDFTNENQLIYLELHLYDHSGISISSRSFLGRAHHAEWDSGQVGWIYATIEKIKEEYGWKRLSKQRIALIIKILEAEVKTYNHYISGNIWWFGITDSQGEEIESCGNFLGYDEAKKEAKEEIDYLLKTGESNE